MQMVNSEITLEMNMSNDGEFILDGKQVKFSEYGGSSKVDVSRMFGKLKDEYAIYEVNAKDLGWQIKSFDEWLNS